MARIRENKVVSLEPNGSIDLKGAEVLWAERRFSRPLWMQLFWPGGLFFARHNKTFGLFRTTDGRYVVKDGRRYGPHANPNPVLEQLNFTQAAHWEAYRVVSPAEAAAWLKSKSRWHARRLSPKL